ncbi:MAG: DMT family transporter [Candidatus Azotimanducaceae bacterium]
MGISPTQSIDRRAGAWYLCLAMLFAASIDVIAKLLTEDFSTAQIVFLRSLFAIPFAYAICFQQKTTNQLASPLWGWQLYRGLLTVGVQFGFFFGLAYLDLVTALMLAYISPVLIVLAANVILKERIAIKRWIGVSIAFSGVLVMLNPSEFEVQPAMIAILCSMVCWALLSISNRQLSDRIDPSVLGFYTTPISILVAGMLVYDEWLNPGAAEWTLYILMALFGALTQYFAALAYKYSQAGAIAPLEYSNLIWAAIASWLIWSELPDLFVWLGGGLIIIGGLISLRTEDIKRQTGYR